MSAGVPRLHAVTDRQVLALADFGEHARALAQDGVALHCRHAATTQIAVETVELLLKAARGRAVSVLINDRADVARATGAHGVHLPADGLAVGDARALVGDAALIGRSAHVGDDARRAAAEGADYVFLGPIWATRSHAERAPLGVAALRAVRDLSVPVIAIGGVTTERAAECLDAGAYGVAAVSALWHAPDPGSAAGRFLLSFAR